ncbi:MAG TPA: hypothetical protein VHZ73_06190, partial [Vicinamibacterales bacterium]|nr:hypothetical protein [Vicinamibacterales bacterium]
MTRLATALFAVTLIVAPRIAAAQDEGALRAFFEGKAITMRIDLPGSQEGVDVRANGGVMDATSYGARLKTYGPSLVTGDRAVVTLVKVKKDSIEFQIGGGGFGTFADGVNTSVSLPPLVDKSRREVELERRVKDESDRRVRRELQDELDGLRTDRERTNRRIQSERDHLLEMQRERVNDSRRAGGSRFNLHYAGSVPRDIRPDDIMASLAEYVDFSALRGIPPPALPAAFDITIL